MFLASLGIVAALAFVLGLVAIAVWALKRFGGARVDPRSRIPVEIVQRIPFGPKSGLAVVRVGEKVMAVSIGSDGIRPLFELDEADRQRVIATSQVATPFLSSSDATAAFAKFVPGALGKALTAKAEASLAAKAQLANVSTAVATVPVTAAVVATQSAAVHPEIPAFAAMPNGAPVTYQRTTPAPRAVERDFRDVLGIAMSGATRLAAIAGLIVLASTAGTAGAQTPPPVPTPPAAPVVQAPAPAPAKPDSTAATTATPATPAVAAPAQVAPGVKAPVTARSADAAARAARTAVTSKGVVSGTQQMQLPAAGEKPGAAGRANAATPAPVAMSDDALAKLVPQMDIKLGNEKEGGLRLNGTVGIVVMMGLLTLLPTLLLMMTGFTRILIVLHFLKQAMGTQSAPPAQLLAAMALLLTGFVMAPTLSEVNRTALQPWMDGKITQVEMLKAGAKPMRDFMIRQTRPSDIKTFVELSKLPRPETADDVPLHVLMSAFVASELRTAFQIGFAIYLPFIVIDTVVASVLMSMGMFMLPPAMISLPFKLLLFVLVDGWSLTIQSLVQSFR